jgi:hypothetical protein
MNTHAPNTGNTHTPNVGNGHRGRDNTLLAASITVLATALLFVASSTATGHQHDYGVKLQLVESISTAAANAASIAREIGSGEIVHEATSPQSAAAVIQQRSDQALRGWEQETELAQLQIDTYFPGQAKEKLDKAWGNAAAMVESLIFISGQVDSNRAPYVNDLRKDLAHQGFGLAKQQWTILRQSPKCYVSTDGCTAKFHRVFTAACYKVAKDIQTYILRDLTMNIQHTDTIFQPWVCTHTVACNL